MSHLSASPADGAAARAAHNKALLPASFWKAMWCFGLRAGAVGAAARALLNDPAYADAAALGDEGEEHSGGGDDTSDGDAGKGKDDGGDAGAGKGGDADADLDKEKGGDADAETGKEKGKDEGAGTDSGKGDDEDVDVGKGDVDE
eukprot:gene31816-54483_t